MQECDLVDVDLGATVSIDVARFAQSVAGVPNDPHEHLVCFGVRVMDDEIALLPMRGIRCVVQFMLLWLCT